MLEIIFNHSGNKSLNKIIDKKQQKLLETHFSKTLFSKVSPPLELSKQH